MCVITKNDGPTPEKEIETKWRATKREVLIAATSLIVAVGSGLYGASNWLSGAPNHETGVFLAFGVGAALVCGMAVHTVRRKWRALDLRKKCRQLLLQNKQ